MEYISRVSEWVIISYIRTEIKQNSFTLDIGGETIGRRTLLPVYSPIISLKEAIGNVSDI